jgi:hypothetical protein
MSRARHYARVAADRALRPFDAQIVRRRESWWQDSGRELGTVDFPAEWTDTIAQTRPFTMVSSERSGGLIAAIEYVSKAGIPGVFVECGVWRGGSVMAAALTFLRVEDPRELWLYDTFEGMTPRRARCRLQRRPCAQRVDRRTGLSVARPRDLV